MADGTTFINIPQTGAAPEDYLVSGASSIDLLAARADFDGTSAAGDFLPALQIVDEAGQVVSTTFGSKVTAGGSASVTFAPFLGRRAAVSTGGGGIDFNKLNDTDVAGVDAGYLLVDVTATDVPPSPFDNYAVQLVDNTPGASAFRKGIGLIVNSAADNPTLDVINNATHGSVNLENHGDGGITLLSDGDGGLSLVDKTAGGLNLASQNGGNGINITARTTAASGIGLNDQTSFGLTLSARAGGITLSTLLAGDITIDSTGNILMPDLPLADPAVSGALWNNGGFVAVSP